MLEPTEPEVITLNDGTITQRILKPATECIESAQSQIRGVTFVVARDADGRTAETMGLKGKEAYTPHNPSHAVFFLGTDFYVQEGDDYNRFGPFEKVQVGDRVSIILNNKNRVDYEVNGDCIYRGKVAPRFPLRMMADADAFRPSFLQDADAYRPPF
eukprot:3602513-Amphidinium_carterae.1